MKRSKKIIERIRQEEIRPIPKWVFTSKNVIIWLAFLLSIFIGSAAFSIVLFAIQQTDFDLISHMSHSRLEWFLGLLPFFWIITLVVFIVISTFSMYHSKRGYKLPWSRLVGGSVALSILLGSLFFIGGGAGKLEKAFAIRVALYESLEHKKKKIWMSPEDGYLSGTIQSVQDSIIQLIDFDSRHWQVDFHDAFIPPVVYLENGEAIKLIGNINGENSFKAEEVRPWGGPQHRNKRKGKRKKEE